MLFFMRDLIMHIHLVGHDVVIFGNGNVAAADEKEALFSDDQRTVRRTRSSRASGSHDDCEQQQTIINEAVGIFHFVFLSMPSCAWSLAVEPYIACSSGRVGSC